MLKASMISAMVLMTGLISHHVNAALISTDWKVLGDAQATLDTETGIEWLDLSLTSKLSFNALLERLQTDLLGWKFATQDQVAQLHLNYAPNLYSETASYVGAKNAQMAPWRNLFGFTGGDASMGVFSKDNGTWGIVGAYRSGLPRWYTMGGSMGPDDMQALVNIWAGYFLVSDGGLTLSSISDPTLNANNPNSPINQAPADVPAHAAFGFLGLLLMAFGLRRRALA